MIKKISAVFLATLIFISAAVPAFGLTGEYFTVSNDVFVTEKNMSELNRIASRLHNNSGYRVCCNLTDDMGEYATVTEYAEQLWNTGNTSASEGGIFVYSTANNEAYFYRTERLKKELTDEMLTSVYAAFALGKSYYEGVKGLYEYLEKVFAAKKSGAEVPLISADDVPNGAMPAVPTTDKPSPRYIIDRAGLFSDKDMRELGKLLKEKSDEHRCRFAVITVNSVKPEEPLSYAEALYKNGGYGYKDSKNGILLMVCDGKCFVAGGGKAAVALNRAVNFFTLKKTREEISGGSYAQGVKDFVTVSAAVYQWFSLGAAVLIVIIIAVIVLIVLSVKRRKRPINQTEQI